ncbi:MAG: cadherin-like domain-containing protein, partial [Nostoc sp.]|uniref:tandem-95 repeat protein n=1 Tax=Nostoc sp. TaxID=1180 RepID=UPI002FFB7970
EDTAYSITATSLLQGFTDVDGDTLSVSGLTANNGTVVNNGNGTYTFNPNANYNGLATLNYNVTDGKGGTTPATSTFSLTAVNDAPALTGTAATLTNGTEDTAYTITATSLLQGFTDVDGDSPSIANLTASNGTVINNGNGTYTFNPNANYNGLVTLNYNVTDGNGGSTTATGTFSLAAINDAPTLTETPTSLSNGRKDKPYTISAISLLEGFTDVDGDTLSVSNLTASNGSLTDNANGTYTFNPNANYDGLVNLNYNVTDGNGGTTAATSTFSVTEVQVNEAPVLGAAASGSLAYRENAAATKISSTGLQITDVDNPNVTSATISITGNYQNGEDILSVIGTLPTGITVGAFDTTTGTITLTGSATRANYTTALARIAYSNTSENPNIDARTVSFTVNDGTTNSNTVTRTINVTAVNDPPTLTGTAPTLSNGTEDTVYTISATSLLQGFTDVDGDTLSIANLSASNGSVADNGNGTYAFNANANYNGLVTLKYNVIDGNGGITAATSTFSLAAINDAPTLTGKPAILSNGTEDTAYTISATKLLQGFTDVEGNTLSVSNLSASNGSVADNDNGTYTFKPNANYNGEVSLNYNVTDGEGGITAATRTFNLAAVNDAPTLTGTAVTLSNGTEDTAYTITATSLLEGFTDVEGDTLSVSKISATNGSVVDNGNGIYTFKPNANYNGFVTLNYNVIDGKGGTTATSVPFSLAAVNDAPVLGAAASGSLAYIENAAATKISSTGLGITDFDNTNITSAIISITGNYQNGEDILSVLGTLPTEITIGEFDTTTGTITLTGSASFANYTTALAQIVYSNTSDNPNINARTVSFTVNDGTTNSNAVTRTINVTAVNDAPVLGAAASDSLAYTENAAATLISPAGLGITDVDNTNITSATISITGNYQKGQDILSVLGTLPTGITAGAFNATTGTVTLTGSASFDNYTTALAQIAYSNTSESPNILARTVSFTVNDGKTNSNTSTRTISVTAVNDAPVLGATASGSLAYIENAAATKISSTGLGITDVDNTNITSATISITGNYQNGQDILSILGTLPPGITAGAFNATTGTITLTGSASFVNYTTALAQIAYSNTSENPNIDARTVSFTVNDGTTNSNAVTRAINVTAVNDAPVLVAAASDSLAYTENAAAILISPAGLGITDVDNTNISSATISITANYQKGQDILSVLGTLPTEITAGAFNATTGTITLTGSASFANYTTALAQIAYSNTSESPNILARTVSFTVNDGKTNSNTSTRTISVTAVNDAPVLGATASGSLAYIENAAATKISSTGLGITDVDNTNITSATISITGNYQNGQDILSILGTLPPGITAGAFNATTGTITLTGSASFVNYTTALAQIAYSNTSENPNIDARTVSFTVNDGTTNSNAVTRAINVTAVNDAPVLVAAASDSLAYTENAAAILISPAGLGITDVDNTNISSATISITANYQKGQDILSVLGTLPTEITAGAFNATTGTITLTGSASFANYTTALAQIAYSNTSEDPNIKDRTISFMVNDGKTNSKAVTRTINVRAVNDAPVLSAAASGSLAYTKNKIETKISSTGLEISDVDNTNITSATISITGNYQKDQDILSVLGTLPKEIKPGVFDPATGTITLTGSATLANYKTALTQIAYSNTSNNPNINYRTVSFTVNDGTKNSNTVTRTINVALVYMGLEDPNIPAFVKIFNDLAKTDTSKIKATQQGDRVKLEYSGELEFKNLINTLGLGSATKSFSFNSPSLIVGVTDNKRTYQVLIPNIHFDYSLRLLTELVGDTQTKLFSLGIGDLLLSEQGISLSFINEFNLDLVNFFSLDGAVPFIDTVIDKITKEIFADSNITLSRLRLNLLKKNNQNQTELNLNGLLNQEEVQFTLDKTKITFHYQLRELGDWVADIPILNSFNIQNPELILSTGTYYLNDLLFGNIKLIKGLNFIGDLDFGNVDTQIGNFIHEVLGIGLIKANIGFLPGLISFTAISKFGGSYSMKFGNFTANLNNLSLGFDITSNLIDPTFRISSDMKMTNYDPTQDSEPELLFSAGLFLNPTSLSVSFNLKSDQVWSDPFGLKDTKVSQIALRVGGSYLPPFFDNFSFKGDLKYHDINIKTAFYFDIHDPKKVALTLTTINAVRYVDLVDLFVHALIPSITLIEKTSNTDLVRDALNFLGKFIKLSIESIDSNGDGTPDPLVQFIPFPIKIADEFLEEGFAINAKLTAWNKPAFLTFSSDKYLINTHGSLKIPEIDLTFLKISGVDDNELNLDLKFTLSERYLKGDGRIEVFGQKIAQAKFTITPTKVTIEKVLLGIPNVLSISVPSLEFDLANLKASGSGEIKLFNQTLADGDFTLDKNGFNINHAQLGISSLLSVEFNNVVVNKSGASGSAKINIAGRELANGSLSLNANGFSLKGNFLGVSAGDFGNIGLSVSVNVGTDVNNINASIDFDVLSQHISLVSVSLKDFTDIGSLVTNAAWGVVGSLPGYITDLVKDGLATISSVGNYLVEAGSNLMNAAVNYFKDQFGFGQSDPIQFNGGNGNDTCDGNDNKDVLFGNGGDDSLHGHLNDDLIDGGSGNDRLAGGDGKDTIFGGDGNDVIWGQNQDDMLYGWAGDDYINGDGDSKETYKGGNDFIDGGIGNDTLEGGYGNDTIYGSAGNDIIYGWSNTTKSYEFNYSDTDLLDGGVGNDTLYGGGGNDTLYGGEGNDKLYGGDGNDYLNGYKDSDTLDGGAGDDLLFGQQGNDSLDGGDGNDTLYGEDDGTQSQTYDGSQNNDTLNGGAGNDLLFGGVGNDYLSGGAGIDTLYGDVGNDTLYGDVGIDTLYGGEGNDKLYGGDGNDYLNGYKDSDTLDGGTGNDLLFGQQGNDSLDGGDGTDTLYGEDDGTQSQTYDGSQDNDTLNGGAGNDLLFGGVGNDFLSGGSGNDTLDGGSGNDTADFSFVTSGIKCDLSTGQITFSSSTHKLISIENLIGSSGNDTLLGNSADNVLNGGAGNDLLSGRNGNDTLDGGGGNDTADFSFSNDGISGNLSTGQVTYLSFTDKLISIENLIGSSGDDFLLGDSANNVLNGGAGNDELVGGAGNDTLSGGSGNDTLYGAYGGYDGNDTADYSFWTGAGGIKGDLSTRQVTFSSFTHQLFAIQNLIGSSGNDTLLGDSANNVLNGGAGNDLLSGGSGNDTLYGGDGNDTADFVSSNYYVNGGILGDLINSQATFSGFTEKLISIENLIGSSGNDTLYGDKANNILDGRGGNNVLFGYDGDDTLYGGFFNDTLDGGRGNDVVYGEYGDDNLSGYVGDDTLDGGDGKDTLTGSAGNDVLVGGLDADDFIFYGSDKQTDRIKDFNRLEGDKILISASSFGTGVTLQQFNFNYSTYTLFFNNQQIATLDNVTNSNFSVNQDVTLL